MTRRVAEEDDWDDDPDWGDADGDSVDIPDDSDAATTPCPYCKRLLYEDAQRCPHCENYISEEDAPAERKPWWIIVGALLCFYAIYRWIVG